MAMLLESNASFDLIVAADVFVYTGQLSAIVEQASRLLSGGGLFAFSTELAYESESESVLQNGYCLRASGRYAHHPLYLQ
ncbi:hypothetical protein [Undibacterium sp. Di24W]|uniref:hypothetical protein n=1 Tax=Undibacterium sp. Di24W TaxID=3413033 RepID=UPI003BF07760